MAALVLSIGTTSLAHAQVIPPNCYQPQAVAKLRPTDVYPTGPAQHDLFGIAIAMSDDIIAVGAIDDDHADPGDTQCQSGAVYIFRRVHEAVRSGSPDEHVRWRMEKKLLATEIIPPTAPPTIQPIVSQVESPICGDYFGRAVAIAGDRVVVGAQTTLNVGSPTITPIGKVFVFRHDGNSWVAEGAFSGTDVGALDIDRFAWSVATDGSTVVASSPARDNNTGRVSIFRRNDAGTPEDEADDYWSFDRHLQADDPEILSQYGHDVAVADGWIFVGAPRDGLGGFERGVVHAYQEPSLAEELILGSALVDGARLGRSLAANSGRLLAGAPSSGTPAASGEVYLFERVGSTWQEQHILLPQNPEIGDEFGQDVALAGDLAVIGVSSDNDFGANSGAAYFFRLDQTPPTGQIVYAWDNPTVEDQFGRAVAVAGGQASIGAYLREDRGIPDSGEAFVYSLIPECCDGVDNDGDLAVDHPGDVECTSGVDPFEVTNECSDTEPNTSCRSPDDLSEGPDCSDNIDNDLDGSFDFGSDPGCVTANSPSEEPQCQDGQNNDQDAGLVDFDGGLAAGVAPPTAQDPHCLSPGQTRERPNPPSCGIGPELLLVLPLLALRRGSRRSRL